MESSKGAPDVRRTEESNVTFLSDVITERESGPEEVGLACSTLKAGNVLVITTVSGSLYEFEVIGVGDKGLEVKSLKDRGGVRLIDGDEVFIVNKQLSEGEQVFFKGKYFEGKNLEGFTSVVSTIDVYENAQERARAESEGAMVEKAMVMLRLGSGFTRADLLGVCTRLKTRLIKLPETDEVARLGTQLEEAYELLYSKCLF